MTFEHTKEGKLEALQFLFSSVVVVVVVGVGVGVSLEILLFGSGFSVHVTAHDSTHHH